MPYYKKLTKEKNWIKVPLINNKIINSLNRNKKIKSSGKSNEKGEISMEKQNNHILLMSFELVIKNKISKSSKNMIIKKNKIAYKDNNNPFIKQIIKIKY